MTCSTHNKRTSATVLKKFPNGDTIKKCNKCGEVFRIAKKGK